MSIWNKLFGKPKVQDKPASGGSNMPPFRGVFTGQTLDGLWVRDEADAKNAITIATWCTMKGASDTVVEMAMAGKYRIIPNRSTGDGGWFCMFGPPELDPQ
jgi:cystathionine beta-lyase/cystathionine gamma-synthase